MYKCVNNLVPAYISCKTGKRFNAHTYNLHNSEDLNLPECQTIKNSFFSSRHAHKSTVIQIKWNQNGNWLLTASRDHLLKLFDIRMMKEMQTFRGHKREATGKHTLSL